LKINSTASKYILSNQSILIHCHLNVWVITVIREKIVKYTSSKSSKVLNFDIDKIYLVVNWIRSNLWLRTLNISRRDMISFVLEILCLVISEALTAGWHLVSGPRYRVNGLSTVVTEFGLLGDVIGRTNGAYSIQLSLIVGLHFSGALVHVYLFCFHALTKTVSWDAVSIGVARALNNLWRLSVVSGSAHYAAKQVCVSCTIAVQ